MNLNQDEDVLIKDLKKKRFNFKIEGDDKEKLLLLLSKLKTKYVSHSKGRSNGKEGGGVKLIQIQDMMIKNWWKKRFDSKTEGDDKEQLFFLLNWWKQENATYPDWREKMAVKKGRSELEFHGTPD